MTLGNPLHFLNCLGSILLRAEDSGSYDNDLGSSGEYIVQIARTYTAIDLDPGRITIGYDRFSKPANFF